MLTIPLIHEYSFAGMTICNALRQTIEQACEKTPGLPLSGCSRLNVSSDMEDCLLCLPSQIQMGIRPMIVWNASLERPKAFAETDKDID